MESSVIFPSFVSIIFSIWAGITLYQYAAIGTRKRVLFVSYLGFIVTFGCVVLISFDIDNTLANRYRSFLYYAWRVMYWSLQLLSWIIFPFNMEKDRTGSWKKSLRRNAIWWVIYAVCGLVAVVYFMGVTNIGFQGMIAFAYALSNSWGLFLIILFAGYGLVAAPQWFYLKSKPKEYMEHLYVQAVQRDDARLAARYDLQDVYNEAKKALDPADPDMVAVATFLSNAYGTANSKEMRSTAFSAPAESDKNTALREGLQTAKRAITAWNLLVKECVVYENLYGTAEAVPELQLRIHQTYLLSMKVFAVSAGFLSVLIIIAQSTIFIDVWWLSVIAIMFRKGVWENPQVMEGAVSSFLIQALITIPPLWMFYCCFWSLTRLKVAQWYGLYPNHNTDTISLMWCGGMLIRISFPLVYNYLFVLRIPDHPATAFEEMQGWMNVVPLLGESFAEYFPLLILVVALLTLSNTYRKITNALGLGSVQFDSPEEPETRLKLIDYGKKLILRERQTKRPSIDNGALPKLVGSERGYATLPTHAELNLNTTIP